MHAKGEIGSLLLSFIDFFTYSYSSGQKKLLTIHGYQFSIVGELEERMMQILINLNLNNQWVFSRCGGNEKCDVKSI